MRKLTILFSLLMLSVGLWAQAEIVYHQQSDPTCEQRGFTQECWENTETGKIYADQQCTQELNPAEVIRYAKFATSPISYLDTYTEKEDATYAGVLFHWAAERGFGNTPVTVTGEAYAMEFTVRDDNPTNARIKWYKSETTYLGNPIDDVEHFHFYVYVNKHQVSDIGIENNSALFSVPLNGLKKGDVIEIKVRRGGDRLLYSTTVAAALEYCSPNCGAISDITITPTAPFWRKAQGTADPEFSYKVDGNVFPNIPLQGITVTRAVGETPGTYTVTASCPDSANPNYNIQFNTTEFQIRNTEFHPWANAGCQHTGWKYDCWEDIETHRWYKDAQLSIEISSIDVVSYPNLISPCVMLGESVWRKDHECNSQAFSELGEDDYEKSQEFSFIVYGRQVNNARLLISMKLTDIGGEHNESIIYTYHENTYTVSYSLSNSLCTFIIPLDNLQYGDEIHISTPFSDELKVHIEREREDWQRRGTITLQYLSDNCGDSTKLDLTAEDFVVNNYNGHTYDGTSKAATVTLKEGITGAGDITVTYKQGETKVDNPTNAGDYDIYVSVAEGDEYKALEETQLVYGDRQDPYHLQILRANPTADMFVYTAPTNLVYDGQSKYAKVDFDTQNGKLSGMGPVSLEYKLIGEGQTETTGWTYHPQDPGTYQVYVDNIGEGTNYHMYLDKFTKDDWQFTITQGALTAEDFDLDNTFATYDGETHQATVQLKQGITGAGAITAITYQQGATDVESPTAVGEYDIYVSVAEGTGYAAVDKMKVGELTISLSNYFYIENKGYGSMNVGLKPYGSMSDDEKPHIAYSLDGVTWTQVTYPADDVYSGNISVSYGNKVYFRACDANDPSLAGTNATFSLSNTKYIKVLCNGSSYIAGGNIMSLLKGSDFESMTEVPSYAFYGLFYDLNYLQDASALLLPATQLAEYCYGSMFYGCIGMSAAPELTATTLASHCYDQMFYNCAVLESLHVAFTDWNSNSKWMGNNYNTDADAGKRVSNPKFYCPLQLNTSTSPFVRNGNYVPQNWDIIKPTLSVSDFVVSNTTAIYDGTPQTATVTLKEGITGAGEMTVTYKKGEIGVASPINAGEYDIYVSVTQGDNYVAIEEVQIGTLTINKATPSIADFDLFTPANLVWNGNPKTVTVVFDDQDGRLTGMGDITVKYNGNTQAPVAAGTYTVTIDVAEGDNYASATALADDSWRFTIMAPSPISVSYIDENGETQTTNALEVKSSDTRVMWGTAGQTSWYVVADENVVLNKSALCNGDVRLILADGAKLTATGDDGNQTPGIYVSGNSNSLSIYGQSAQTGQLIAHGGNYAAGIGGASGGNGSNIFINGGVVTATGGQNASGIGGGYEGSGSNIKAAAALTVYADNTNPPTTEISHTDNDIASHIAVFRYVIVKDVTTGIKDSAIAAINAAIEGVTNTDIIAIATNAIDAINAATSADVINAIKEQALAAIAALKAAYAAGQAEGLGEMGTPCDDCPAVEVTKGTKTIRLYNPDKVEFKKE